MATGNEIQMQLDTVKSIEYDLADAKRTIQVLKKMAQEEQPDTWSWITIHGSNDTDEILIRGGNTPTITREFMIQLIEDHYIEPLRQKLAEARTKLKEIISEEYSEEYL